jgi:hypothetical protein
MESDQFEAALFLFPIQVRTKFKTPKMAVIATIKSQRVSRLKIHARNTYCWYSVAMNTYYKGNELQAVFSLIDRGYISPIAGLGQLAYHSL